MNVDLASLGRTLSKRGKEEESVRPSLLLVLFSELSLVELAPHAAAALREYTADLEKNALRSALIGSEVGVLTAQRLSRDLKRMDKPRPGDDYIKLRYSSSANGHPGDYGVTFLIDDMTDPLFADESNLLQFEFPWQSAEKDPEAFFERVVRIAAKVPLSVGTCGFGFSHWHEDKYAVDQVYTLLPRYIGFDHSSETPRTYIRDCTPTPSWLTFVKQSLFDELGGAETLARRASAVTTRKVEGFQVLRSSRLPPIGDVNRGAPDIGELPGLAEFLAPKRVVIPFLRGNDVELDVDAWLSRFDQRQRGSWENR
jgi:hypothetical protein